MTLAVLHARFLQHCAVEKRLRPMTIKSYRSDFGLFLGFLRRRSKTLSQISVASLLESSATTTPTWPPASGASTRCADASSS